MINWLKHLPASIQSKGAKDGPEVITLADRAFEFVDSLRPIRDDAGRVKEFYPQAPANCVELHKYGHGPFCKFSISAEKGLAGLYALVVNGQVMYIGECQDLVWLVNNGYGTISPSNLCKKGGTSTNCKLNMKVLEITKAGRQVDQYFYPYARPQKVRHELKMKLIYKYSPPWNG